MAIDKPVIEASEALIGRRPVIVRRRVRWGDCDPAQVVFTPRFSEYVISAAAFFFDEVLGKDYGDGRADNSNGFPFRALSFAFEKSLRMGQSFDMRVDLVEIATHTFTLAITGLDLEGGVVFRCRFTPVSVAETERRATPLSPQVRAALERYAGDCPPL